VSNCRAILRGVDEFFTQVGIAANNGLYFLALAGALTIPDICGALESDNGWATGAKYAAWFDKHVASLHTPGWRSGEPILSGETCYQFRCSFLHQGTTHHLASNYSRIMFVECGATSNIFHMNVLNGALNIDVRLFCLEMVTAAQAWRGGVVGTELYETNLTKFVARYPQGLAPYYFAGVPVIG